MWGILVAFAEIVSFLYNTLYLFHAHDLLILRCFIAESRETFKTWILLKFFFRGLAFAHYTVEKLLLSFGSVASFTLSYLSDELLGTLFGGFDSLCWWCIGYSVLEFFC